MMSELFDEEYLRQQYYKAETKKIIAETEAKGMEKGKAKAAKAIAQKLRNAGMSEEQIKEITTI